MACRFANSGTVATSRSASRAILALNVASNFLRDLVISVLHRLRQSRTLHTLTFGPISGVHFSRRSPAFSRRPKIPRLRAVGRRSGNGPVHIGPDSGAETQSPRFGKTQRRSHKRNPRRHLTY